jgi:hypothetical protein
MHILLTGIQRAALVEAGQIASTRTFMSLARQQHDAEGGQRTPLCDPVKWRRVSLYPR